MLVKSFALVILFLAVTPTVAIFTARSFLLLFTSFLILCFVNFYHREALKKTPIKKTGDQGSAVLIILLILLAYASQYYGGLYQDPDTVRLGGYVSYFIFVYVGYAVFIAKKLPKMAFILLAFVFLSLWTIINSPAPYVDTFYVFGEAPRKLVTGQNPYSATFTRVYENITPDYYNYLPFSFIFLTPFVLLFSDPRYAIVFAMFFSALIFYRLFSSGRKIKAAIFFVALLLFLPRSFYMLEHVYFDTVIFFFFLLFIFFIRKNKNSAIAFLFLGLFYSFKQHFVLTLPFLLQNKIFLNRFIKPRSLLLFFLPFLLPAFYLLTDHQAFIEDVLLGVMPGRYTAPIERSLTLPTFIRNISINSSFTKNLSMYQAGLALFAVFYFFLWRSKIDWLPKLTLFFFGFSILAYHGFFNSYYLVSLFLLFEIAWEYFDLGLNL